MSNLGFMGPGTMGRPMAGHLIAGGHKLFLHGHGEPSLSCQARAKRGRQLA
jgi:3-hydroxyisobutyrate dehydrogenase-like beta-hydroxyacid dehydrogenase